VRTAVRFMENITEFFNDETKPRGDYFAWSDLERMGIEEHSETPHRDKPAPEFTHSDAAVRDVVLRYLERNAGLNARQCGDYRERLARAQAAKLATKPALEDRLKRCEAKHALTPSRYLKINIDNLKTQLANLGREAQIATGCILYYWRCGYDSVQTGEPLGIRPQSVRVILHRLERIHELVEKERLLPPPAPRPDPKPKQPRVCRPRQQPHLCNKCGVVPTEKHKKLCAACLAGKHIKQGTAEHSAMQSRNTKAAWDNAHAIATFFGVDVLVSWRSDIEKTALETLKTDFVSYVLYCARLGIKPMRYAHWHMLASQFDGPKKKGRHTLAYEDWPSRGLCVQ
jgi:hypothetical protein